MRFLLTVAFFVRLPPKVHSSPGCSSPLLRTGSLYVAPTCFITNIITVFAVILMSCEQIICSRPINQSVVCLRVACLLSLGDMLLQDAVPSVMRLAAYVITATETHGSSTANNELCC